MTPRVLCDGRAALHVGDCLEALREMPSNSVDSVVTYSDIAEARIVHAWKEWCEGRRQGALFDCAEAA